MSLENVIFASLVNNVWCFAETEVRFLPLFIRAHYVSLLRAT